MSYTRDIRNVLLSEFYCEECGMKIPLPRKKRKQREKGHIKHLHCVKCQKITAHTEVRSCDLEERYLYQEV